METLSFIDILGSRAFNEPDRLAFVFMQDGEIATDCLTYQSLDRRARAIAAQLQSLGMEGKRALLLYSPGLEFVSAFFGCLYAGVVAVPAYPPRRDHSLDRLLSIITNCQTKFVLTTTSNFAELERRFSANQELKALFWLDTDTIPSEFEQEWQKPAITNDTLAFLQYTSGSTSMPKGVMVTHGNLLHNSEQIYRCFEHTPDSQGVVWLPPYHDMGLIGGILQPVYVGFPVTLMSPLAFLQKPIRWLEVISQLKATTSGGPNFAYELCINKITPEQCVNLDLSSWEVAFNGAEPIRAETLERFAEAFAPYGFRRKAFYPCYGMAEATLIVSGGLKTALPIISQIDRKAIAQNQVVCSESENSKTFVSLGKAWLDQKIIIVDPETLTQCSSGRVGEIWVSGSSIALGYWNQPEASQQTFQAYLADTQAGPFLRTGDLGFFQDGELFITGRLKDLIIIRGHNYYPQDIELTVEQSHPALRIGGGAAFAVEIDGVERLVIAQEVERHYLRQLDVNDVVGAIRQAISEKHELQVHAVVLLKTATILKTSSGKIQRHLCRTAFLEDSLEVVGEWQEPLSIEIDSQELQASAKFLEQQFSVAEPASTMAEQIQSWLVFRLSKELKISSQEIDIQEAFAYYGLDSSAAIAITGELIDWLGCEVEPTLFWEYPNIEELACYLAELLSKSSSSVQMCFQQ
ncbi:AMP-binding protein [Aetokthonos hydrillicola Thurmond2011]|jgi:acyl-CoA synthetase (AMP-forming)/AMP-acid ligase II/acyl carrier protein|uniref:AMP-binding protein n=1 Tax=Aetokthonos hydrillicola Thurmond2011 TaxID=2712845 RepID=A0AAP5I9N9_9CYAN|nr:AMP-binding protein [Aetokthonos hydrillicola]MBO3462770.1 AMP-binding protein [Aetokthonos hydrillicola CCALA 1050]MBW4590655.1 AMP-binding protein [Aetokthonos hydrillicola CCALA 1050]MDR9895005.1 AMP-binding protein [Aetokthonos hydrillicola Thurmond2011]